MSVKFDHVALGAPRIDEAAGFIAGELGGVPGFGANAGPYRFWHWDFPGPGRIEVIEPAGRPGGFVHRFLERDGPGIHHVTFKVPSLDAACDRARSLGYDIVGYDASNAHWQEAFLHPREAMGIVVQIVHQAPHEAGDDGNHEEYLRLWGEPPPVPSEPPSPVRVVAVRMHTADRERALRQWGELLEGTPREEPDGVSFAWDGCGMRVAVRVERGASDASEAIEVAADRRLALPEGPHPTLGAVFRQVDEEVDDGSA